MLQCCAHEGIAYTQKNSYSNCLMVIVSVIAESAEVRLKTKNIVCENLFVVVSAGKYKATVKRKET